MIIPSNGCGCTSAGNRPNLRKISGLTKLPRRLCHEQPVKRSAWKTLGALLLSFAAVFSALEGLLVLVGVDPLGAQTSDVALLQTALAFVGVDLAVGLLLIGALVRRLREEERDVEGEVPAVSVLLPFWNEGVEGARATVNAWAAQRGLVKSLAREWGPAGVRINCLARGSRACCRSVASVTRSPTSARPPRFCAVTKLATSPARRLS